MAKEDLIFQPRWQRVIALGTERVSARASTLDYFAPLRA